MAKRQRQTADDGDAGQVVRMLPGALQRQITAIKRPVMEAARQFGTVRERVSELAPRVMSTFNALTAHDARISFVDFVRMLDPTVPTHAADRDGERGYRNHPTYYTLQYMRRTVTLRPRGRQGVRDSATDGLARALATILQIVTDTERVWQSVQAEFNFSERAMTGLRRRVDATRPLFRLTAQKPVKVGNVIHMESARREQTNAQPAAEAADTGNGRKRRTA